MATSSERPILSGAAPGAADVGVGGGISAGEPAAVKARGFWEQAWRRFRRDRVALVGGVAIIVMILVAFVGTPIANHLLGRTAYTLNTNAQGFEPALPWTHARRRRAPVARCMSWARPTRPATTSCWA